MPGQVEVGRIYCAKPEGGSTVCRVEVTSIERVDQAGVHVYGYRQYFHGLNRGRRQTRNTQYPRPYFIPNAYIPNIGLD